MGRPTKLTPERQANLVQMISIGLHYEAACKAAGVDYVTFRRWILRGENAKSGIYSEFSKAIKGAEARAEATLVGQIRQQAPKDWRAALELLKRRWPDRWGDRQRIDINALETELAMVREQLGLDDEQMAQIRRDAVAEGERIIREGM